jgi:hypothetical protein
MSDKNRPFIWETVYEDRTARREVRCYFLFSIPYLLARCGLTVADHLVGHLRKNDALLKQKEPFGWSEKLNLRTIELGMCHKKILILGILFPML